jgi:hypothetical protein
MKKAIAGTIILTGLAVWYTAAPYTTMTLLTGAIIGALIKEAGR